MPICSTGECEYTADTKEADKRCRIAGAINKRKNNKSALIKALIVEDNK